MARLVPASEARSKQLFFGVMGTPYQSELTTSLIRIVQAALHKGHHVIVWCCGYATGLTQSTVERDPDIFAPDQPSPSIAELVGRLVRESNGRLKWYVCDYCMRERGCSHQIEEAHVKVPFSFYEYLNQADSTVVLGVKS